MESAAAQAPSQAEEQWIAVDRCPACGSAQCKAQGALPDRYYVFGSEKIRLPDAGIKLFECCACGLIYKTAVPAPAFLAEIFGRQAAAKWSGSHDFSAEATKLLRLMGRSAFDVLDVGAADGALLKACAESGIQGRRSALDVLRYPGVEGFVSSEFIEGFLDDALLQWSREPYDVVTLFDVLEHLYQPQRAFANLGLLVKPGGQVVIETGNIDSFWPRRFGIHEWWYVRLFEHHVFWTPRALTRIAAVYGFELVSWTQRRHKSRRHIPFSVLGNELLKTGLYCVLPDSYTALARLLGKQGNQPWFPFARDHLHACLKKKG
ncbi:class I SAM-dependent methyltransferase [Pelomicrobium sp.]|jgi:SAM-dependent methyltransferase|uniref:class I SAM-dependent methyltransferase n=1 Tax=Pelomicrobium sp. TaxID=2815319 RepID=UPI002FDCE738